MLKPRNPPRKAKVKPAQPKSETYGKVKDAKAVETDDELVEKLWTRTDLLKNGWTEVDEATANAVETYNATAKVGVKAYHSTEPDDKTRRWVADSGTNRHVTNDAQDFMKGSIKDVKIMVGVGNGFILVRQQGDVMVKDRSTGFTTRLKRVLLMPKCARKLISVPLMDRAGCEIRTKGGICQVLLKDGRLGFRGKLSENKLYVFEHVKAISRRQPPDNGIRCKTNGDACLAKHRHSKKELENDEDIYQAKSNPIPIATFLTKEEYGPEPTNLAEEEQSPFRRQWKEARNKEMKSHEQEHKTWKLVPRPANARVFKPKCVWKLK